MYSQQALTRFVHCSPRPADQRFSYGNGPPLISPDEEDILEQALRMEEEQEEEDSRAMPVRE